MTLFSADCIKFWRYFDTGEGITVPRDNEIFFLVKLLKNYYSQDMKVSLWVVRTEVKQIFLVFCAENGCSKSFESVALLEEHVLADS